MKDINKCPVCGLEISEDSSMYCCEHCGASINKQEYSKRIPTSYHNNKPGVK